MKQLLGYVVSNEDDGHQRRIQAHITGLTEGAADGDLPWAFPLENQNVVPEVGEKVWIYVESKSGSEDYDYSRQYYRRFTEETYKETYDYSASDAFKSRDGSRLDNEPDDANSVTYPENKVVKLAKFTVEFDLTNQRFSITDDTSGTYISLINGDVVIKSSAKRYDGVKGDQTTDIDGKETKKVKGDMTLDVEGKETRNIKGDLTQEVTGKTTIKSTGNILIEKGTSKIEMTATGVKVSGTQVEITGGLAKMKGVATPSTGPFCALPNCLFTGAPHTGQVVSGT